MWTIEGTYLKPPFEAILAHCKLGREGRVGRPLTKVPNWDDFKFTSYEAGVYQHNLA